MIEKIFQSWRLTGKTPKKRSLVFDKFFNGVLSFFLTTLTFYTSYILYCVYIGWTQRKHNMWDLVGFDLTYIFIISTFYYFYLLIIKDMSYWWYAYIGKCERQNVASKRNSEVRCKFCFIEYSRLRLHTFCIQYSVMFWVYEVWSGTYSKNNILTHFSARKSLYWSRTSNFLHA